MSLNISTDANMTTSGFVHHTTRVQRYQDALSNLPAPGHGHGLHTGLLSVANLGRSAGFMSYSVFRDLRGSVPVGARDVSDAEIRSAVETAFSDNGGSEVPPRNWDVRPRVDPGMLSHLIEAGIHWTVDRITKASPIEIPPEEDLHAEILLNYLYSPDEILFIGDRYESAVQPVSSWLNIHANGAMLGPHIIPNPLTGELGVTKSGNPSYRSDDCVRDFRFAVVEFDGISILKQTAFWGAVDLPVAAIIDSGSKSLHAWIRVDQPNREAWERNVEVALFAQRLVPLGVDAACRNESRLSRMPGFIRPETGRCQRLIYLAPQGRRVSI
jgi:hypothetical protein